MSTAILARRPGPDASLSRIVGGVGAIVAGGAVAAMLLVIGLVTPKFEEIFRDFGVALSEPTRAYLSIGRLLSGSGPLALLVMAIVAGGLAGAGIWLCRRTPVVSGLLAALIVGLCILAAAGLAVALFIPMAATIESLRGNSTL